MPLTQRAQTSFLLSLGCKLGLVPLVARVAPHHAVHNYSCAKIVQQKESQQRPERKAFPLTSKIMDTGALDGIVWLLDDIEFKSELRTFRRSFQRLKIRLRNNKLMGNLKELITQIKRLEFDFPSKLFKNKEVFKTKHRTKTARISQKFCNHFIRKLDKLLDKGLRVYCETQPHFRVGHLLQHFIVLRASLARLIFCYRALLVYVVDFYLELDRLTAIEKINSKESDESKKLLTREEAKSVLLNHHCKPREEPLEDTPVEVVNLDDKNDNNPITIDEVGPLIDRATRRPMRACKRK